MIDDLPSSSNRPSKPVTSGPIVVTASYRGRFAPTPSGALHLGSLLTALASWLDARSARGRWLLRIDDLDRARCPAGAEPAILSQLEAHGLTWDESPRRQSAHLDEYAAAIDMLERQGLLYPCRCTRARLTRTCRQGTDGPIYAGTCRNGSSLRGPASLRFRLADGETTFDDRIQGSIHRDNTNDIGDFAVRRSDGIFGYHLACAVDEQAQGITDVVRGADLLSSTLCQLQLMRTLGHSPPHYAHLPVLLNVAGLKLSKQNHARPIDAKLAGENLVGCLELLGQSPPTSLERAPAAEVLDWAVARWRLDAVPKKLTLSPDPRTSNISSNVASGIL